MDETHLMRDVQHKLCYVSLDFLHELKLSRRKNSAIMKEYVLPTGGTGFVGYVKGDAKEQKEEKSKKLNSSPSKKDTQEKDSKRTVDIEPTKLTSQEKENKYADSNDSVSVKSEPTSAPMTETRVEQNEEGQSIEDDEMNLELQLGGRRGWRQRGVTDEQQQTLKMNNERITVPEILFNPSDIGLDQGGVAELIVEAIEASPKWLHPLLYSNIITSGGTTLYPNFNQRLENEVRALAPIEFPVNVYTTSSPLLTAWNGASAFASLPDFSRYCVSRQEYQEYGSTICVRKFWDNP